MNVSALNKLLGSSTAWLGAIVAAVTTYSQTTALPVAPWLSAAIVGAYGLKEVGAKIAGAMAASRMDSHLERMRKNGDGGTL